jgi:tRNA pseudouridine38-40 synthase
VIRIRLTIAFDGTAWHGWHAGRSGRGVADQIQKAIRSILPDAGDLVSSSRTDSGVHALGLVAHFDTPYSVNFPPAARIAAAINARLPGDIRVRDVDLAPSGFHARFDAVSKEYRYRIWNAPVMNPHLRNHAWHVPRKLNLPSMRTAASSVVGPHDFRAFTSKRDGSLKSTIRTVFRCGIRRQGPLVTVTIEADGFLYKMCRALVGTFVRCGIGLMDPEEVIDLLDPPHSSRTPGMNAPAHGLTLWQVRYPS